MSLKSIIDTITSDVKKAQTLAPQLGKVFTDVEVLVADIQALNDAYKALPQ